MALFSDMICPVKPFRGSVVTGVKPGMLSACFQLIRQHVNDECELGFLRDEVQVSHWQALCQNGMKPVRNEGGVDIT